MPIVLGNGKIHLDVRPQSANSIPASPCKGTPGHAGAREADTGVEMQAGQTLAIAGLVQTRIEAENGGLPWISEVPYLGAAFRNVHEQVNEVELLIMVTPELVEAMDANEVPPCGPGMQTTSPSDWELFMKGHLEVPNCCPTGAPRDGDRPQAARSCGPPPDGMIRPRAEAHPARRRPAGDRTPPARYNRYIPSKPNAPARRQPAGSAERSSGLHRPRRL